MSHPISVDSPWAERPEEAADVPVACAPRSSNALAGADAAELHLAYADGLLADGRAADTVPFYMAAHEADPARSDIARVLMDALLAAGEVERAVALGLGFVDRWPDRAGLRLRAARALAAAGRWAEARAHLQEAMFLAPHDLDIALDLGIVCLRLGEAAEAVALLQRCRRADPDDAVCAFHVGAAWQELGETAKARAAYRDCLRLDPDDTLGAAGRLAALDAPEAATTRTYVRTLFDQYADRFDRQLIDVLRYGVPAQIRDMVAERLGPAPRSLDILDLGCGTGLAGVELAPWARRLAGVDLSPRMVEKARERQLYTELEVGDLMESLTAEAAAWDLVVAADVLIYLGDLASPTAAVARALRPGGAFVASVEKLADGRDYALGPTRRYAYGRSYLERTLEQAGLRVEAWRDSVLRYERGQPVEGYIFLARRDVAQV